AAVAAVFAQPGVSIETVRQKVEGPDDAELVIVTHRATDEALTATVEGLNDRDTVRDVLSGVRVEGEGGRGIGADDVSVVARRDRGVPGVAAGHRVHAGGDAPRRRYPARSGPVAVRADRM